MITKSVGSRQWRLYPLRNSKSKNRQPHMSSANRAFCLPSPVAKSCTVVGSEKQWCGHFFQHAQAFNKDHSTALIEIAPKQNATYMHCNFHDCCMAELNERLLKIDHKRHCLVGTEDRCKGATRPAHTCNYFYSSELGWRRFWVVLFCFQRRVHSADSRVYA